MRLYDFDNNIISILGLNGYSRNMNIQHNEDFIIVDKNPNNEYTRKIYDHNFIVRGFVPTSFHSLNSQNFITIDDDYVNFYKFKSYCIGDEILQDGLCVDPVCVGNQTLNSLTKICDNPICIGDQTLSDGLCYNPECVDYQKLKDGACVEPDRTEMKLIKELEAIKQQLKEQEKKLNATKPTVEQVVESEQVVEPTVEQVVESEQVVEPTVEPIVEPEPTQEEITCERGTELVNGICHVIKNEDSESKTNVNKGRNSTIQEPKITNNQDGFNLLSWFFSWFN